IWTAFETLVGDLWEVAVNIHPHTLAAMRGVKGQEAEGKQLPASYLERFQYDVKDKMGTILKEHRCDFTSLSGIAEAYRLAFPRDCKIHAEEFWQDRNIKACCLIRNAIVHKAGIVDEEFLRKRG